MAAGWRRRNIGNDPGALAGRPAGGLNVARKFLVIVAALTGLVILAAILWRLFAPDLIRLAFVPPKPYSAQAAVVAPDYAKPESWVARPGLAANPAQWTPAGFSAAPKPAAAVFFVSPTAWLSRSAWNAPLDDPETNERLDRFTRMQASVFNGIADVWVPRYRQATFGSFLAPGADADRALALALSDVERAFDAFLAAQPADRPILIAGHSQGARHILRLLESRRVQIGDRLVGVWAIGWPVTATDLSRMGLRACTAAEQAACVLSWQSFAADGELAEALAGFAAVKDLSGTAIGMRPMLCVNPLTGGPAAAGPERNAGMLQSDEALVPRAVGAKCDARGLLLISPTPAKIGPYVLPGGNFHVYDYGLFWANVRADAEARLSAHGAARFAAAPADVAAADGATEEGA
jgi:hypothetical protein